MARHTYTFRMLGASLTMRAARSIQDAGTMHMLAASMTWPSFLSISLTIPVRGSLYSVRFQAHRPSLSR
jgi:hypothetical protein